MNRERIGIDLDDVLLDLNPALCAYHNDRHGTDFRKEDVTDYDLWKLWGCSQEELFRRIDDFYEAPEHLDAATVPGSETAIPMLAERYDLFLVTAKPGRLRGMTEIWLDRYFPDAFREIRFTGGYQRDGKVRVRKSDVCRELGIRTFVDDALGNVRDLAPHMDRVFLLDAPWNREGYDHPSVVRAASWDDIVRHLE